MDSDEITNPKKTLARREAEASAPDDGKKGRDAGDLPGPAADFFKSGGKNMSQAEFSQYPAGGKRSGPPADMLKKRASKD